MGNMQDAMDLNRIPQVNMLTLGERYTTAIRKIVELGEVKKFNGYMDHLQVADILTKASVSEEIIQNYADGRMMGKERERQEAGEITMIKKTKKEGGNRSD